MAWFAWTAMPVYRATILLVRMICFVSTVQCTGKCCGRVRSAMTTSSSEVLPARSPSELRVTSTCRAPAPTAARELAVARPRSLWQCVDLVRARVGVLVRVGVRVRDRIGLGIG